MQATVDRPEYHKNTTRWKCIPAPILIQDSYSISFCYAHTFIAFTEQILLPITVNFSI